MMIKSRLSFVLILGFISSSSQNQNVSIRLKSNHSFAVAWKYESLLGALGVFINSFVLYIFLRYLDLHKTIYKISTIYK